MKEFLKLMTALIQIAPAIDLALVTGPQLVTDMKALFARHVDAPSAEQFASALEILNRDPASYFEPPGAESPTGD